MSSQPSVENRSFIRRSFSWLCSRRGIRRLLIILIWMITVVAVFYGIENWRGSRAWRQYQRTVEARGEQIHLPALIPPPIPDEQNFASTPFVQSWFVRKNRGDGVWGDDFLKISSRMPNNSKAQSQRQMVDLGAWQKVFTGDIKGKRLLEPMDLQGEARTKAAVAVLEEMKSMEPIMGELREASRRPRCRYPVQYDLTNPWGILLPHLSQVIWGCRRLQLKACAELAVGRADQALEDTKLSFYMLDTMKEEPFLMAYLVRVGNLQTAVQPVWEGLKEHRWNEEQLKQLQSWFEKANFKAEVKKPLDTERAAALWTVDLFHDKGNFAELATIEPDTGTLEIATKGFIGKLLRFMPRGWSYQEQLTYCRLFDEQFEMTLRDTSPRLVPTEVERRRNEVEGQLKGRTLIYKLFHHQLAAALLLPGLENMGLRTATAQVCADEAGIACALERYRLANNRLPEKLEELSPKFMTRIPQDVLSGQPYKYRREGETAYVIYSVGWNERDDGGSPGRKLFDEKEGDWVWQIH